jgi:hypothetical protein
VLTTVIGLLLAPIAVVTGVPWMNVNWFDFFARWALLSVPLVFATVILRRQRVLRPNNAKVLSWESWLFSFARWPYVLFGACFAIKELLVPKPRTIKVTPKGEHGLEPLPLRLLTPYIVVALLTMAAVWARSSNPAIRYYVVLCLMTGGAYVLLSGVVSILHAVEARRTVQVAWSHILVTVRGGLLASLLLGAAWLSTVLIVIPKLF